MEKTNADIVAAIIIGSIIFVILAVFTLMFFLLFVKKRRVMQQEKEMMQVAFQQVLLSSQLEMQEQTFNAISRELHDHIGQVLSLARVQVHLLEHGGEQRQILQELKNNLGSAMQDLRDLAKSLSGDRLGDMRLEAAIEAELGRVSRVTKVSTLMKVNGDPRILGKEQQVIVFRMVQESLQNIIKHADADRIDIHLHFSEKGFEILIQDNGKGFDTDVREKEGMGLKNLKSRAAMLQGNVAIQSKAGTGTQVKIAIPYE